MLAVFHFKSGQKISIDCESVSAEYSTMDGRIMSYEIKGIKKDTGYENPIHMMLSQMESITVIHTKPVTGETNA